MSVNACAALVERADPDRFLATMAASPDARPALFALYAFNVEVSRAPWVTKEDMIAEMRLQWWRDALEEIAEGKPARRHEVVDLLAEVLTSDQARTLDALVAARRWDIYSASFEDAEHFKEYLAATAGVLMWVAAQALGADAAVETRVREIGAASGLARFLKAVPELEARGRVPLVDGTPPSVARLAQTGLDSIAGWRRTRGQLGQAGAALTEAWEATTILRQAARDPRRVATGRLGLSPFSKRLTLIALS